MATATATAGEAPGVQAVTYAMDPTQVHVGTPNGPGIYLAPAGTAGPVDTKTNWPAAWQILGYASDAGPVLGQNTTSQDIIPWQSVSPVRSVITQRQVTLQIVLWQLNDKTMSLYFDADPPVPSPTDGSFSMAVRPDKAGHPYAIGIDALDAGGPANSVLRMVFQRAILTAAGNMAITRGAAVPLDCTLSAQVDGAGNLCTVLLGPAS